MTPLHLAEGAGGFLTGLYISFWLPALVLTAALVIKLPSILKLWRDPLLRAVGGLLLFACAVFVFAAPGTIAWTNRVTGVPNIAAPWVYSLLTALSASWLLLVVHWRNGHTDRREQTRRATRWVVSVYAGVVVALWVLFALADVPVEQIRDLDTYYASTPFMREEILLYLLAHAVACSITTRLVWNWIRTDGLDGWLRWGLRFLGIGYATNLLFGAAKLTAVVARWTGHDLDWLNTNIAPSAACIAATFVAIGFIVPHAGQYLQDRWLVRRRYRSLKPLARLLRTVMRRPRTARTAGHRRDAPDPPRDLHPRRAAVPVPLPRRGPAPPGLRRRPRPRPRAGPGAGAGGRGDDRGRGRDPRARSGRRRPERGRHHVPAPGDPGRLRGPGPPRRDLGGPCPCGRPGRERLHA